MEIGQIIEGVSWTMVLTILVGACGVSIPRYVSVRRYFDKRRL